MGIDSGGNQETSTLQAGDCPLEFRHQQPDFPTPFWRQSGNVVELPEKFSLRFFGMFPGQRY